MYNRRHYHLSFKPDADELLGDAVTQEKNNCFAVGTVRDFELKMKMNDRLRPNQKLSIQEVINLVPRRALNMEDGGGSLLSLPPFLKVLTRQGTVLDQYCPFTQEIHPNTRKTYGRHRYKPAFVGVQSFDSYEARGRGELFTQPLEFELEKGPLAVELPVYESYNRLENETYLYNPSRDEIEDGYLFGDVNNHILLATCSGYVDGLPILRCQDSYGMDWGDGGYVTVVSSIISDFFTIRLD